MHPSNLGTEIIIMYIYTVYCIADIIQNKQFNYPHSTQFVMLTSSVFFSYRKTVFLGKCSKYFLTEKQRISFSTHSKNIKRISNVCLCKICCENPFAFWWENIRGFCLRSLCQSWKVLEKQDILQQIPTRKISLLILVS